MNWRLFSPTRRTRHLAGAVIKMPTKRSRDRVTMPLWHVITPVTRRTNHTGRRSRAQFLPYSIIFSSATNLIVGHIWSSSICKCVNRRHRCHFRNASALSRRAPFPSSPAPTCKSVAGVDFISDTYPTIMTVRRGIAWRRSALGGDQIRIRVSINRRFHFSLIGSVRDSWTWPGHYASTR